MIPKKIHFIWVQGYDAMPDDYKRCVDSWAPKNPGSEHVWMAAWLNEACNAPKQQPVAVS